MLQEVQDSSTVLPFPERTGLSKLGLETGLRLVSLRHYLGLLHGDFCLR